MNLSSDEVGGKSFVPHALVFELHTGHAMRDLIVCLALLALGLGCASVLPPGYVALGSLHLLNIYLEDPALFESLLPLLLLRLLMLLLGWLVR